MCSSDLSSGGGRAPGIVPDPAMMNLHGTEQAGQSLPYVWNVMNDMQNVRHDLCADNPRFYALSALAELRGCHVTLQPDTHGAAGVFSGRLIPRRDRYHPLLCPPGRPAVPASLSTLGAPSHRSSQTIPMFDFLSRNRSRWMTLLSVLAALYSDRKSVV